jgi:putative Mn2+ efflux pump MntP
MGVIELILLAIALSMDAFAVSICAGLSMVKVTIRKSLVIGLYFGLFHMIMPIIGYFAASLFAESIMDYGVWIAFAVLGFIGVKMMIGSFKKKKCDDRECPSEEKCADRKCPEEKEFSLRPAKMLPLAVATSIDVLAVGATFAFLRVAVMPAVLTIGMIVLVISMTGVKIGGVFGTRFKSKAELAGGIILVLLGLQMVLEHII